MPSLPRVSRRRNRLRRTFHRPDFPCSKNIRDTAAPIVVLTGGEPLVRPDFFQIAEFCTKTFTRVALATNGTLIDDPIAQKIAAANIQRVSISLDGSNPDTHDQFRGLPGSFDAAINGIHALKRAGVSFQINTTVTQHNHHELQALLDLAISLNADAFHLFMLVPVGCGATIPENQRLTPKRSEEILTWLFEKSLTLKDRLHIKATCAPQYFRIMHETARKRNFALPKTHHGMQAATRGCLAGSNVCFISRTANVQPCGYLPIAVGNALTQSFKNIWTNAPVFQSLRNPANLKGKCQTCTYRTLCQGCRARAYAATNDFLAKDPDCPLTR